MARLTGQIIGRPKGKVGDLVFKSLYGNTLIVSAPTSFRTPMDEASITRRSKFRFVVKLSSAIIRCLSIKVLWKKSIKDGKPAFGKLFSAAYDKVKADLDISGVRLFNNPGFLVNNPEVTINPSSIKVDMEALGATADVNPTVEKKISLEGIVYLSSPLDETDPAYSFLPFSSDEKVLDTVTALSFTVPFSAGDALTFQGYTVKKVLAALVTKDANGDPVKASMTFFN